MSGSKKRRPALDRLLNDARRRRFDVLICWRLDRLGRNLRHLVTLLDELQALDVGFVSLDEGIDLSTPAGKLQLHILAALAEFERGRIQERVRAGLARARRNGKRLGRLSPSGFRASGCTKCEDYPTRPPQHVLGCRSRPCAAGGGLFKILPGQVPTFAPSMLMM